MRSRHLLVTTLILAVVTTLRSADRLEALLHRAGELLEDSLDDLLGSERRLGARLGRGGLAVDRDDRVVLGLADRDDRPNITDCVERTLLGLVAALESLG